ncbi:MAG: TerB family tellurite resistance protein, partial [Spirochaetales bacterium]|nr:TerB family tellurite resistance protein [Spirochaetales bacterium]
MPLAIIGLHIISVLVAFGGILLYMLGSRKYQWRYFINDYTKEILSYKNETFFCPYCNSKQTYHLYESQNELAKPKNSIICQKCHNTYDSQLIQISFDIENKGSECFILFGNALKGILIKLGIADKKVTKEEKAKIRKVYGDLTGNYYLEETMIREMQEADKAARDISDYVNKIKSGLTPDGAALLMRSAILVSLADNELHPKEKKILSDLAEALNLPSDMLDAMI